MLDADQREEEGRAHNHPQRAPAIKGVQKAHHPFFVFKRAGLDNRAHQNLDQAAAHGVQHNRDQDPRKGDGQQLRQEGHREEADCRQDLGDHHAGAVADPVGEFGRRKVDEQLRKINEQVQ